MEGINLLSPGSDVVIIVDVLSFSTCVDIVTARGAAVIPYRSKDASLGDYARSVGAVAADPDRASGGFTLSPASLLDIPSGTRLVLPSPNGSTLSLASKGAATFAGCLRNAQAVASAALKIGGKISLIPAGERWSDGTIRFAVEDLIGAGAIISYLEGARSPEAATAEAAFLGVRSRLAEILQSCGSGRELISRGFPRDVALASELNCSRTAPRLVDGAYRG